MKKILNFFGIDLIRYPNRDLRRRIKLLKHYKINKVIDVGANIGQYGKELRKAGFEGGIISIEPLDEAFKKLKKTISKDNLWHAYQLALGESTGTVEINVSKNLYSSSMLDIADAHVDNAPNSAYVSKQETKLDTLDNLFPKVTAPSDNIFVKLDVQGFENVVLNGAKDSLKKITGMQIEMSLTELYKNQTNFIEIINRLSNNNFSLLSLENGFFNSKTGQLLQVDGVFFKND
jgi:FkbM family methyltransferase